MSSATKRPGEPPVAIRPYDHARDLDSVERIWREVGWIEDDDDAKALSHWFSAGHTLVATLNDVPECAVQTASATMRLQQTDLPMAAVTAVTTSRIARGHAFAQRLTALQLAASAASGAAVSALGMFDQGFYDKLGFATGSYEHALQIDPGQLRVDARVPTPKRLGVDDYAAMHSALCQRRRLHGAVVLKEPALLRAELSWDDNGFGLGYETDGVLTHFVWLAFEDGEHGPYTLRWLCYQNDVQLRRLLGMLKSLSDQVYSIDLTEPPELQLQVLLERPFRQRALTEGSDHQSGQRGTAWWQFRVLDLRACVAALQVVTPIAFNLELQDPLAEHLPAANPWRGLTGRYRIELGQRSQVGSKPAAQLPTLHTNVGSLARLLWGVMPASSLSLMQEIEAPADLLAALDAAICLPRPSVGWEF